MSENTSTTELTSQYSTQVSADLASNAKEQDRVGEEIALLQEQLAALQRDHQVLVSIQRAIESAPVPAESGTPSGSNAAPARRPSRTPRKKAAAKSGAGKQSRTKKTAPEPDLAASDKKAAQEPEEKSEDTASARPTLVELVRRHLTEQREPRSAAEISTALGQAHPDRGIKTTVVRTTLEGLVARTKAQRTKQGSSVYYTSPDSPQQSAAPQAEEKADATDA